MPEFQDVFSTNKIIKNLLVVSVGFLFLFTAFQSLANLVTSLSLAGNIGSGGMALLYGALVVSCMFVPPFMISHLGCKWTIPISMIGYILYMGANFHPVWALIGPAAVLLGIGGAPLWSAKCTYLTQIGVWYSKHKGMSEDAVINSFFGIFFMIFQTSQIWGNLLSSLILKTKDNLTMDADNSLCGANFCPQSAVTSNLTILTRPSSDKINIVMGVYTVFACVGAIIIILFLDKIVLDKDEAKAEEEKKGKRLNLFVETFLHFWKSRYQKLLVPLTIYSGVEQAFITGSFTRAYISCSMGVWNVGLIMICYGVVDAICSFSFGRLVQYVGHIPFFILAFVVHCSCQIALLLWTPDPDTKYVFYIFAGMWGMGDAIIQTQINAYYGYLFTDNTEAAFSNYRLWESIGFIICFGYNDFLCVNIKLYLCITFLVLGMVGYGMTEVLERKSHTQ